MGSLAFGLPPALLLPFSRNLLNQPRKPKGGNGLYILDIKRTHKIERADLLDSILFNEEYGQVTGNRMFYVMSGQVLKVTYQAQ